MDLQLSGKRALVTGSTSGIGAEIARMLAAEGVRVVVHGRNVERAQAVARHIENAGGQAAIALGDLMTDEGERVVIQDAAKPFGGIDILETTREARAAKRRMPGSVPPPRSGPTATGRTLCRRSRSLRPSCRG